MTKIVEVVDALMGSGKTSGIIKYMADNPQEKWLVFTPSLSEAEVRVPEEALKLGLEFYVPEKDEYNNKSEDCLSALKSGLNVCCTHALMNKFTTEHLEAIKQQGYCVVSDEELSLIQGYRLTQGNIKFLLEHKHIEIAEDTGQVKFLNDVQLDNYYYEVKAKADLGMLYATKGNENFLVVQLPPKIVEYSKRFILLTYNYKDSIMEIFLKMHGFNYKELTDIQLYKTNTEILHDLRSRIEIIDSKSFKEIRNKYTLSKTWWLNASKKQRKEISDALISFIKYKKVKKEQYFYTAPKDFISKTKGFDTGRLGRDGKRDEEGNELPWTRTFIACNARSTNIYADKDYAFHCYDLHPNQAVKVFLNWRGYPINEDVYALNMLLQWMYRGCIRKKGSEVLKIGFLSARMKKLFESWLYNQQQN